MRALVWSFGAAAALAGTGAYAQSGDDGLGEAVPLAPAAPARGGEDALGEAVPLAPAAPAPPPGAAPASATPAEAGGPSEAFTRGYAFSAARLTKIPAASARRGAGPDLELGLAFKGKPVDPVDVFAEGRGLHANAQGRPTAALDQAGVRVRPAPDWTLALGKERNRRAPGLILSPSDVLYSRQNLPGQREDRAGVWLARASWQTEAASADLIALPVDAERANGMPAAAAGLRGYAARGFWRTGAVDLTLDAGRVDGDPALGASAQTFVAGVWKVYGETGRSHRATSHLVGAGYEGSDIVTAHAELYRAGAGAATPLPGLSAAKTYAILSVTALELRTWLNLTGTAIKSLEDRAAVGLARAEALVGHRHAVGATLLEAESRGWQASIDWKVSF